MTDWPSIAVRFALYVDLLLLFGLPLFGLHALRGKERHDDRFVRFRPVIAALALLGLGLSSLGLALLAAAMGGTSLAEVDVATHAVMITETAMGMAWQVRTAALILAAASTALFARSPVASLAIAAVAGAIALATLSWSGHAAATEGAAGAVHLAANILHLLAAGAWLGALGALSWLLVRATPEAGVAAIQTLRRALAGFSLVGTLIVGLIVATGLVNAYMLVGAENVLTLTASLYGKLLAIKLVLFMAMLGVAAANRFRLTPALDAAIDAAETRRAIAALRRSLALETGAALSILGLVAWLGTLAPPSSVS